MQPDKHFNTPLYFTIFRVYPIFGRLFIVIRVVSNSNRCTFGIILLLLNAVKLFDPASVILIPVRPNFIAIGKGCLSDLQKLDNHPAAAVE